MAKHKSIPDSFLPKKVDVFKLVTTWDKQEKSNGKRYELTEDYHGPGILATVQAEGTTIVECNDGWYNVLYKGERMFYRVGDKVLEDMKELLKNVVQA